MTIFEGEKLAIKQSEVVEGDENLDELHKMFAPKTEPNPENLHESDDDKENKEFNMEDYENSVHKFSVLKYIGFAICPWAL